MPDAEGARPAARLGVANVWGLTKVRRAPDGRAAFPPGWKLGAPEKSRLILAVHYADKDLQMPPKQKLTAAEIDVLVEWVKRGAPDPRSPADSVTSIGSSAFQACTSLKTITVNAYQFCTNLTTVTIGNSITYIAPFVFYACTRLTEVYFQGNAPILGGSSIFDGEHPTISAGDHWLGTNVQRSSDSAVGASESADPKFEPQLWCPNQRVRLHHLLGH